MNKIRIEPKRKQAVTVHLALFIFGTGMFLLPYDNQFEMWYSRAIGLFVLYIAIKSALSLLLNRDCIELDENGITVTSSFDRKRIDWLSLETVRMEEEDNSKSVFLSSTNASQHSRLGRGGELLKDERVKIKDVYEWSLEELHDEIKERQKLALQNAAKRSDVSG